MELVASPLTPCRIGKGSLSRFYAISTYRMVITVTVFADIQKLLKA